MSMWAFACCCCLWFDCWLAGFLTKIFSCSVFYFILFFFLLELSFVREMRIVIMGFSSFTWPHHLTFITISKTCVCGEYVNERDMNHENEHDIKIKQVLHNTIHNSNETSPYTLVVVGWRNSIKMRSILFLLTLSLICVLFRAFNIIIIIIVLLFLVIHSETKKKEKKR